MMVCDKRKRGGLERVWDVSIRNLGEVDGILEFLHVLNALGKERF